MSLALVRKELREHGPILLASGLLSLLALTGLVVMAEERGGRFVALNMFTGTLGMLNALVAANRLFVREYAGRTQLFLEVLPISRARVFATKWLVGALWIALLITIAWASVLRYQQRTEVIELGAALHALSAALVFALTAWSFAVMAGMLGRHRYTVWIAMFLTVGIAVDAGNLAPHDVPVINLLSDRVAMARGAVPWPSVLWAVGLSAAFTLGAAALALIGSGAIASTLARRMTARERVFMLVSVLVAGFVYSVIESKRQKPPFDVVDATYIEGKHARIGVMATEDLASDQLLALCKLISADVDALIEALDVVHLDANGKPRRPAVFIMPQHGLDRSLIERASLSKHEGIVLRAAPDVSQAMLRAEVLHELINDASLGRALREDRHALLDGLAVRMASRADAAARELLWLRFASSPLAVDERRLTSWEESMEALGQCGADALAFAAVDTLAQQLGEPRTYALLKTLFARPPKDVRVLFEATPAERLAEAGVTWAELARSVEARRLSVREQRAAELAAIPRRKARIAATRSPKRGVSVQAHVQGAAAYRVLYTALGAWTGVAFPLSRLDVRGAAGAAEVSGTVPISLPRGSRLFAAIDVEEPILQCPLRLHAERVVLP